MNNKQEILDYITNNVEQTSGNNVPLFDDTVVINKTMKDTITQKLEDELGNIAQSNQIDFLYDDEAQLILIYGLYQQTGDTQVYRGYIYLVDKDLNEVGLITEFTSGSKLFAFTCIKQAEDKSLYAVSVDQLSSDYSKTQRVCLLNNVFTTKNVVLRRSYIAPNTYTLVNAIQTNNVVLKRKVISKMPGEAVYYILGMANLKHLIIRFTINVGSENTWEDIEIPYNYVEWLDTFSLDYIVEKTEDGDKIYFYQTTGVSTNNFAVEEYIIENDTPSLNRTITFPTKEIPGIIYAQSTDSLYVTVENLYEAQVNHIATIYKVVGTSLTTIETFSAPYDSTYMFQVRYSLIPTNNIFIYLLIYGKSKTGSDLSQNYIGIIQNDIPYHTSLIDTKYNLATYLFTTCSYNLLNLYQTGEIETIKYTLDYNPNNYNGLPYSDYNQTVSKKGRLYSNGNMVFARNLYNKTLLNSSTTSTLQVPNTLLNDIEIDTENLIGETNKIIVNNTTPITKNVYETLYINFTNTLSVIDEDTDTYYPATSNYINQNINVGTQANCSDTFVGKVLINFSTPITQSIEWTWNVDHYETSLIIDCMNDIPNSIEFISNDETTTYITKKPSFTVGNLYVLKQKLRIE